jgi:hypothetical protein
MSTRKGGERSRPPAHQNSFSFKHNPKSKKTAAILASPNTGLCRTCHAKIEWKKKYRKYKPLTKPANCNGCRQKTVKAAYHTLCVPCAREKKVCAWCAESKPILSTGEDAITAEERIEAQAREEGMPLRQKKTLLRAVHSGSRKKGGPDGEGKEGDEEVEAEDEDCMSEESGPDGDGLK